MGAFCNTWGVEHHVFGALKELGYEVERFDHRRGEHPYAINTLADMSLVLKGDNIHPNLVERFPRPTVLWYGEIIHQSSEIANEISMRRIKELTYNIGSFDFVFHHDYTSLETIRKLGAKDVFWVHTSGVNPKFHKKMDIPKVYDIGFTGSLSQRRKEILDYLGRRGISVVFKEVFGKELNRFINQCKIFLNIHFTEILNTETRINEILGVGGFALSEEVSMPDVYVDGEHLAYWKLGDIEDLVGKMEYYLDHDEERAAIALKGFKMVHSRYKYTDRCKELINIVHQHIDKANLSKYGDSVGVMFDAEGERTFDMGKFYAAVRKSIGEN